MVYPLRQVPPSAPQTLPSDSVIAIDGPAGSGKSTTARELATHFGLLYIDSGAMYRALTSAALSAAVDPGNATELARLLQTATLELKPARKDSTVIWNGRDVSTAIRTPAVDAAVSTVSAHPEIRRMMVERQRTLGRQGGVVMEGRDIGSVVFPLATTKIYLDASIEARAERRYRQFRERGEAVDKQQVINELNARDTADSERKESPLTVSPDAIVLDTSTWTFEQQIEQVIQASLLNPYLDTRLDTDLEKSYAGLTWQYKVCYTLFQIMARFFGMTVFDNDSRAVAAGTIIVCNHVSWYDPPLSGAWLRRYPVHTLAKAELFKIPFFNWLFRSIDAIPIQRKGYDHNAFNEARAALERGANLFLFPEGTRRAIGHPGPVKSGIGILAQETGADVQTLFIRGTCGLQPGGSTESPLQLYYGPVVRLHALNKLRELFDRREVSRRIAALFQSIFEEMQARSFARYPETDFEKKMGRYYLKKYAQKNARLFGNKNTRGQTSPDAHHDR